VEQFFQDSKPSTKRITKQRRLILETLRATNTHPSADELYLMVKKRLPKISLGTVYRNLEVMSELGLIQCLEFAGRQKRFDGNPKPHYHFRCINCDRIFDLDESEVEIKCKLKNSNQFQVKEYRLEILGYCKDCQQKQEGVRA